jgi:hypothetical protein
MQTQQPWLGNAVQHLVFPSLTLLLSLLLCSASHAEQTCHEVQSSQPTQMQAHDSGWVLDTQSGLMWQRCALGQTWYGQRCQGQAHAYTFAQAQAAVHQLNQARSDGFNDWKLPHLKELAFIAHPHCQNPRVSLALFPDTPSGVFWSRYTRIVNDFDPHVFTMDFAVAGVALTHPDEFHFVRLVRKLP